MIFFLNQAKWAIAYNMDRTSTSYKSNLGSSVPILGPFLLATCHIPLATLCMITFTRLVGDLLPQRDHGMQYLETRILNMAQM